MTEEEIETADHWLTEADRCLEMVVKCFPETLGRQCDTCGASTYSWEEKEIYRIRSGVEEQRKKIARWLEKLRDPNHMFHEEG